jgi:hypothetical protein
MERTSAKKKPVESNIVSPFRIDWKYAEAAMQRVMTPYEQNAILTSCLELLKINGTPVKAKRSRFNFFTSSTIQSITTVAVGIDAHHLSIGIMNLVGLACLKKAVTRHSIKMLIGSFATLVPAHVLKTLVGIEVSVFKHGHAVTPTRNTFRSAGQIYYCAIAVAKLDMTEDPPEFDIVNRQVTPCSVWHSSSLLPPAAVPPDHHHRPSQIGSPRWTQVETAFFAMAAQQPASPCTVALEQWSPTQWGCRRRTHGVLLCRSRRLA